MNSRQYNIGIETKPKQLKKDYGMITDIRYFNKYSGSDNKKEYESFITHVACGPGYQVFAAYFDESYDEYHLFHMIGNKKSIKTFYSGDALWGYIRESL